MKYTHNKIGDIHSIYIYIQTLQELYVLGGRYMYHMNMLHMLPWPVYNPGGGGATYCSMTGDLYLVYIYQ